MKTFMSDNVPDYAQEELEQIKQCVSPLMKKSSVYMFISMFLLMISLTNLYFLVFYAPSSDQTLFMIFALAVFGAFGMALVKETRFFNIEIKRIANQYINERINRSDYLTDGRKKEYIRWVDEQPFIALNTFIDFLNEEENKKKRFLNQ
ncbi:DUF5392 family protein [Litchfieldia salsa]|uniref:Uncharacterized protein n=1 Tax=Litchfieldia salsa TaxID=930152 RepID=A0A1H0PBJ2_9BACI|nr:DUF5392 family protein [Litchfieldia salsa]SDP02462.1 hypothetical protein SAMN05216565_101246 [Litchfieldia salsa]